MKLLSGTLSGVAQTQRHHGSSIQGAFWSAEVTGSRGEASLELHSGLGLLSASSLESQSFVLAPPTDEVARNLQALTSKCHHGKNCCRQVLCLYELSKVGAEAGPHRAGSSDDSCEGKGTRHWESAVLAWTGPWVPKPQENREP